MRVGELGAKTEQKRDESQRRCLCSADLRVNLCEFGVFARFSGVRGTFSYWNGDPSSSSSLVLQSLGLLLTKGL